MNGATFDGSGRLTVADPDSKLTYDSSAVGQTISLWFKLDLPSGETLSKDMALIVDRSDSASRFNSGSYPYSYCLYFDKETGNLNFSVRGSAFAEDTVIERPFLSRWYHVAIVRSGNSISAYVDGERNNDFGVTVSGNSNNDKGVSIGGWASTDQIDFKGEIQEVRIFATALSAPIIRTNLYEDLIPTDWPTLRGYYKLNYKENETDSLINSASDPSDEFPNELAKSSGSTIKFDETNQKGEQSVFDANKNKGEDAISPLGGGFSWDYTVLNRPIEQQNFEINVGYRSSNQYNWDSYRALTQTMPLGPAWSHSLETRLIPDFTNDADESTLILRMWNGSQIPMERGDYDFTLPGFRYSPRSGEYNGELEEVIDFATFGRTYRWVTPSRLIYEFNSPYDSSALLAGRLTKIADFSGNETVITLHQTGELEGEVNFVTDSAGGVHDFVYNGSSRLEKITFDGWETLFTFADVGTSPNITSQISKIETKSPESGYPGLITDAPHNVATDWEFTYDSTSKLLTTLKNPKNLNEVTVTYDSYGRKTEEKDALNRITKTEHHKPEVRQLTVTDPRSQKWVSQFDRKGRVIASTDPLSRTTRVEYDEAGNPIEETDAKGSKTRFEYDDRSNITKITNALGQVTTYTIHSFFNTPTSMTNPEGWTTTYEIDWDPVLKVGSGGITHTYDGLGTLYSATYDTKGRIETSTDANGNVTSRTYDAEGFLVSLTVPGLDSANYTTNSTYNKIGWLLTATNPLGETVKKYYNVQRKSVKTVDALSREILTEYDGNGNLLKHYDAKGGATVYTYNDGDERVTMTTREGRVTDYTYTASGKLEMTKAPLLDGQSEANRYTTTLTYDNADRRTRVTDPATRYIETTYDVNDNVTEVRDQLGNTVKTRYDVLNRVVETEDPLGNTVRKTYDLAGRESTTTTPKGHTSTNTYDDRGRLSVWSDPSGGSWIYRYDENGNILEIEDALGGIYRMTYGPRNERIREENQDAKVWEYVYDELGRIQSDTDPNGLERTHHYDPVGRKSYVEHSTGRVDAFQYDVNDNIVTLSRTGGLSLPAISNFSYDSMDRISEYRDPFGKQVGYTYDAHGRRKTLVYPGLKTLTYVYDNRNRIERYTDWLGNRSDFEYDDSGRLTKRTYPNGIEQSLAYDAAGRLTDLKYQKDVDTTPTDLIAYQYAYDTNGNIDEADELGTLDWQAPPHLPDEVSTFSQSGRIETRRDLADSSGDRDFTYTFDETGNLTRAASPLKSFDLTYDEDNRTTSINYKKDATSVMIENRYDALGRRISRNADTVETRFVHDLSGKMEHILSDTDATGKIAAYYVYGPGGLHYRIEPENDDVITAYHSDASGNVIALSGDTPELTNQYAVTPYGRLLDREGTSRNWFTFSGAFGVMEEPDVDGIYFMRARYYLAEEQVFLGTDPIKWQGLGWTSMRYNYAGGNPMRFADPDGNEPISIGVVIVLGYVITKHGDDIVRMSSRATEWVTGVERNADEIDRLAENSHAVASIVWNVASIAASAHGIYHSGRHLVNAGSQMKHAMHGTGSNYKNVINQASKGIAKALDVTGEALAEKSGHMLLHSAESALNSWLSSSKGGAGNMSSISAYPSLAGLNTTAQSSNSSYPSIFNMSDAQMQAFNQGKQEQENKRLASVSQQSGMSVSYLRSLEKSVGSKVSSGRSFTNSRGKKITIIRHEKRSAASIRERDRKYRRSMTRTRGNIKITSRD